MSSSATILSSSYRFHIPFEHGAWWSYFSTLAGGLALVLMHDSGRLAGVALALSLAAGFMAQDWGQALLAALLRRRSQAVSQWQAWPGWALAALALAAAGVFLEGLDPEQRTAWILLLLLLALGAGLGLLTRILQSGRGRKSLAATALLLALPALPLGVLAFGFTSKALAFWAWPLAFYPAATLAAQSYIRGFPDRARWAGPALAGGLAGLSLGLGAVLPGLVLAAQALRLQIAIARRWREQPEGLPPGNAIRAFGQEQAFFGVTLTILWVWAFL